MEKISIIDEKDLENKDISQILRASIKKLKKRWSPLFPLGVLGDISRPIGLFPNLKGLDLCGFSAEKKREVGVLKKKDLSIINVVTPKQFLLIQDPSLNYLKNFIQKLNHLLTG